MKNSKKIVSASKELIAEITKKVSPREQAIFTIIRQTGLSPQIISQLRYKDLEQTKQIPRKIEVRQFPARKERPPVFIGEDANFYLNSYLAKRNNLTPQSLLFSTRTGKKINTKNLSRTFRQTIDKISTEKRISYSSNFNNRRTFSIYSLVRVYQENAKGYEKALKEKPNENDEFYRRLYKEKAMVFLDFQSSITIHLSRKQRRTEIENIGYQTKELKQTIVKDNEYISSILTLLYNNKGDYETRQNEEMGDNLIELWKQTRELQLKNLDDAWTSGFKIPMLHLADIVEELTKTLERIKKPYDDLERKLIQKGN